MYIYREREEQNVINHIYTYTKINTLKLLGIQSSDRSPRARRRDLRCATPNHGNPRCSPNREQSQKHQRSHPRDMARTLAAVPQEEVYIYIYNYIYVTIIEIGRASMIVT